MNFRSCYGGLRKTDGDQILGSNTTLSVSFKSHQWMSRVWTSFLHYPVFKISTLSTICVLPVKTVGVFDSGAVLLKSCKGFFFFFLNNEEKMCSEVYFRTAETSWQLSHCNVTVFFLTGRSFAFTKNTAVSSFHRLIVDRSKRFSGYSRFSPRAGIGAYYGILGKTFPSRICSDNRSYVWCDYDQVMSKESGAASLLEPESQASGWIITACFNRVRR